VADVTTPWEQAASNGQAAGDDIRAHLNSARRDPIKLDAIRGDLTAIRRTRWAWQDWAPLGSFLLLAGEPGAGKGVWVCHLLAHLTRGTAPGDLQGTPANVLWVAFEDSWEETVLPRMVAAGADVQRVYHLEVDTPGEYLDLMRDQQELARLVDQHELKVVCFEAVVDHLQGVDDYKNAEVRRGLAPLVELARQHQALAIGTTHLNKTSTGTYRHRVAGSGGYLAVARVGLLVHRHPDDPDLRVVCLGKGNLGRVPDSMVFAIESRLVENPDDPDETADVGVVAGAYFDGSLTVDEVLAGPKPDHGSLEDSVVDFLTSFLKDGPRKAVDLYEAGAIIGLGEKALKRHKDAAGVSAYQEKRAWWWRIGGPHPPPGSEGHRDQMPGGCPSEASEDSDGGSDASESSEGHPSGPSEGVLLTGPHRPRCSCADGGDWQRGRCMRCWGWPR
jgi:hypothetical protein